MISIKLSELNDVTALMRSLLSSVNPYNSKGKADNITFPNYRHNQNSLHAQLYYIYNIVFLTIDAQARSMTTCSTNNSRASKPIPLQNYVNLYAITS